MKFDKVLSQGITKRFSSLIKAGSISTLTAGKISTTNIVCYLQRREPIWDPWILKDGDVYRLFYLVGSKTEYPWFKVAAIHGAISADMRHWKSLGVILEPEPANAWESGRMLAGFAYKEDGVYYLFYSAAGKNDIWDESIGLATSIDGLYWQRYSTQSFLKPDDRNLWYGKYEKSLKNGDSFQHFHWRDPYIVKEYKTGKYYMFICAASKERETMKFRGCVGLAVANKITGPYELLPPAAVPVVGGKNESPYIEMERPQVIYKNGKYHLFFSCWSQNLNPKWVQKVGWEKLTNSSVYWYISDNLAGPFTPVSDKPVVKGSERTGMYGTNFFPVSDKPEKLFAYGWYPRWMATEISPRFRVHWNNDSIRIDSWLRAALNL